MRIKLAIFAFALTFASYGAKAQVSDSFREAEKSFNQATVEQRLDIQMLMTAAGYWAAVPNTTFGRRLYSGIRQFQKENGFNDSGSLDAPQLARLFEKAAPMLQLWGFREVTHPLRNRKIWVPFGLGLEPDRNDSGIVWADARKRVRLSYAVLRNSTLNGSFEFLINKRIESNDKIHFKIIRPDFFVISFSSTDGLDSYIRFHVDGNDLIGFWLSWRNEEYNLHVERVATLISGSLWATMNGLPFPSIPQLPKPAESVAAIAIPKTEPPSPSSKTPDNKPVNSSGTGFFVTEEGHILTNAHVVDGCNSIEVTAEKGRATVSRLITRDVMNDLALIKIEQRPAKIAEFKSGTRLGEQVAAFGFPLSNVLSSSGNFTLGNVTALSGIGDDSRFFQISAPVQPGNSGGPLFDQSGNLVGVVAAKLNALKSMIANNGDIPQNVNFAIKGTVASNFLESNRINIQIGTANQPMAPADLADKARSASVYIFCRN